MQGCALQFLPLLTALYGVLFVSLISANTIAHSAAMGAAQAAQTFRRGRRTVILRRTLTLRQHQFCED